MELGEDARRIIEDQIRAHRYPDAEAVVMAALESLISRAPDEFEPGELDQLLREGEQSIAQEGTLDVDEAFQARRARRTQSDAGAA